MNRVASKFRIVLFVAIAALGSMAISGSVYAGGDEIEYNDKGIDETIFSLNDIMFYQQCPADDGTSEICGSNQNYAGEQVFTDKQMEALKANQPFYEKAANEYGFPWQIIAVIHTREHGLARSNPDNGQGVYQFYSAERRAACKGGDFTPGKVSDEQFQIQTNCAAEAIKNSYGKGYDLNTDDGVKNMFFSYNGRAQAYIDQALRLGFSKAEANNGEGSPYVMNRYDAKREPSSTWGQIKKDGGSIEYPANNDFGAFVYYKAITCDGSTVNPDDSAGTSDDSYSSIDAGGASSSSSSGSSSAGNSNAQKIAEAALKIAWPKGSSKSDYDKNQGGKPTEEMKEVWKEQDTYDSNISHGPDCGYFVQTVIAGSGVDPDYNKESKGHASPTIDDWAKAHPSNWEVIDFDDADSSKLQSGDIIWAHGGGGTGFHTWIVADIDGELYEVEASYTNKLWGRVSTKVGKTSRFGDDQIIIRAKGGSCNSCVQGSLNINGMGACLAWPLGTDKEKYTLASGKVLESMLTSPGVTDEFPGTGAPTKEAQIAWVKTMYDGDTDLYDGSVYSWRYGAYCCGFTALVVRYSGVDEHFSGALSTGGYEQVNYAKRHSDIWDVHEWNGEKSDLQGGDVLVSATHSWMVVEDESGEMYRSEAGLTSRTFGHIGKYSGGGGGLVYVIRAKNAKNSNAGVSVTGDMSASSLTGTMTNSGKGNHDIGASAIELAWPESDLKGSENYKKKPTDKFLKVYTDIGGKKVEGVAEKNGRSCDYFAHTVIVYAGLGDEKDFPWTLSKMYPYLASNNDWEEVQMSNPRKTSEYKSGDVIIFLGPNGSPWHVGIYAETEDGKGHVVQASHSDEKDPGYFGVVKDTYNITSNTDFASIKVYRNKNNKKTTADCNICDDGKNNESGGVLKDGGFDSVEEAENAVMKEYRDMWNNNNKASSKYFINVGCNGVLINNCPSFVRYFVNKYGNKTWKGATGHGKDVAANVASHFGIGTTKTPNAYAVFSGPGTGWEGHTGIVLGVNTAKGKIIIGEAGCGSGLDFIHAKERNLSDYNNGKYTFTENLNSVLKKGAI